MDKETSQTYQLTLSVNLVCILTQVNQLEKNTRQTWESEHRLDTR